MSAPKRRPIFDGFKSGQVARLLGPPGQLMETVARGASLVRRRDTGERRTTTGTHRFMVDGVIHEKPIQLVEAIYAEDRIPVTAGDVVRVAESVPGRAPNVEFLTAPDAIHWGLPIGPAPGKIGDPAVDDFVRAVLRREPWSPELKDWPLPPIRPLSLVLVREAVIGARGLRTLQAIAREHDCLVLIETPCPAPPITPAAVPLDWQPDDSVPLAALAEVPAAPAEAWEIDWPSEPAESGPPPEAFRAMTAEAVRAAKHARTRRDD